MNRKMLWIAVWTTLTLWLGNFWGCAASPHQDAADHDHQNTPTEMATNHGERDIDDMNTANLEHDSQADDIAKAVDPHNDSKPTTVPMTPLAPAQPAPAQPAPQTQQVTVAVLPAPATEITSVGTTDGSSGTLNRSNWATVNIQSVSGSVRHYPLYFEDYPFNDQAKPFEGDPLVDAVHALDDPYRSTFSSQNLTGIFVQPVVFGLDAALVAPNMITSPPWTHVYSD